MKRIIKKYVMLYNSIQFSENNGWHLAFRFDRIQHGFWGDVIKLITIVAFGDWNNWGENLLFDSGTMWWLYYGVIPLFFAFMAGFFKEAFDQQRGGKFDWGDIWATTLPFVFVYHPIRELLWIVCRRKMEKITNEIIYE